MGVTLTGPSTAAGEGRRTGRRWGGRLRRGRRCGSRTGRTAPGGPRMISRLAAPRIRVAPKPKGPNLEGLGGFCCASRERAFRKIRSCSAGVGRLRLSSNPAGPRPSVFGFGLFAHSHRSTTTTTSQFTRGILSSVKQYSTSMCERPET